MGNTCKSSETWNYYDMQLKSNHRDKNEPLSDELVNILKYHNLYKYLHEVLCQNNIHNMDTLRNDVSSNQIEKFCDDKKIKGIKRIKLRKLMRIINKSNNVKDYGSQIVILIKGDKGVGKTALIRKYTQNSVNDVGYYVIHPQELSDGSVAILKIHDNTATGGSGPDATIICYDKTNPNSLTDCKKYTQEINCKYQKDHIVMVIGCKSDKAYSNRKDEELNAQNIMTDDQWNQRNILAFECSAETGDNVKNVFVTAAETVLTQRQRKSCISEYKDNNNNDDTTNQTEDTRNSSTIERKAVIDDNYFKPVPTNDEQKMGDDIAHSKNRSDHNNLVQGTNSVLKSKICLQRFENNSVLKYLPVGLMSEAVNQIVSNYRVKDGNIVAITKDLHDANDENEHA